MTNKRSKCTKLELLRDQVVHCKACPRLVKYRQRVAQQKKREFRDQVYWGKPVPGFGDSRANIIIIGLAPAAHGANRTGRMFTGDSSGSFLMKALYRAGLASMPKSETIDDSLRLTNIYLTAVVRCAPPKNRPTSNEIENCRRFLHLELDTLRSAEAVLTLGRVAFQAYKRYLKDKGINVKGLVFSHGSSYQLGNRIPCLFASYHPSRQNTQTGRLTKIMFHTVIMEMKRMIEE